SEDFLSTSIPPRQKFETSFDLCAGDGISWNFKTDSHDIGFWFLVDEEPMFPYVKADAHVAVQIGLVDVVTPGTYSIVFDNTHSKYR
ncbi:unnamed protein product, partial [Allacma fusca]